MSGLELAALDVAFAASRPWRYFSGELRGFSGTPAVLMMSTYYEVRRSKCRRLASKSELLITVKSDA